MTHWRYVPVGFFFIIYRIDEYGDLATVARTGSYNDLLNKPSPFMYVSNIYSGTTTSASNVITMSIMAGTYLVIPCGYVSGYGAYITCGSYTGTVESTERITVSTTTNFIISPTSPSSTTTWTNYHIRLIRISS